jgi:hypothetical protein
MLQKTRDTLIMLIGILLTLFLTTPVHAAVWYVRAEAPPGQNGTSWGLAFNTIQSAVDTATASDQIWIKRGTYALSAQINVNGEENLYGGFNGTETSLGQRNWKTNVTIIDGQNSVRCISIAGAVGGDGALIDGFTITGGKTSGPGGGIYIATGTVPTINHCIISNNQAGGDGGGICHNMVSSLIFNCQFRSNTATGEGGAIHNESSPQIASSPVIVNCTFLGNQGYNGGGVSTRGWGTSSVVITNCVFYKNTAQYSGGGIFNIGGTTSASNCILWANTASDGPQACNYFQNSTMGIQYSDIQNRDSGGVSGPVNKSFNTIDSDPSFVSPDAGDFRLRNTSPCIDMGDNDAQWLIFQSTDIDGNNRIIDGDTSGTATVDMGAYEFVPGGPVYGIWHVDGGIGASGDGATWATAFKTIQEAVNAAVANEEVWVKEGTYLLSSQIDVPKTIAIYGGFSGTETYRGDRNWTTNETIIDGQNLVRCFRVLGSAIIDGFTITQGKAGSSGGSILTGGGGICIGDDGQVFQPAIINCKFLSNAAPNGHGGALLSWKSPVAVSNCSFETNSASVSYGQGGAVYGQTAAFNITNCTFTGNTAIAGGGAISFGDADGAASPSVTSCTFISNSASSGSGGALYSGYYLNTTINSCKFFSNTAAGGGGAIYIRGYYTAPCSPKLTNCLIAGNSAGSGGGLYFYNQGCTPTITNCTITGNSNYGISFVTYPQTTIINSIVWGNSGGSFYIDFSQSNPTVTYSDIGGGYTGTGNINVDPLFIDADGPDNNPATWQDNNYHVQEGSPCVDTGNTSAPNLPGVDLDGKPRVVDGNFDGTVIVDMGAFEVAGKACTVNSNCDDGLFCNGAETCVQGLCQRGSNPCAANEICEEPVCKALYTLSVTVSGSSDGYIEAATAGGPTVSLYDGDNQTYVEGTTVSVTAIPTVIPGTANIFAGWSGALTGLANPGIIFMDSAKTLTASFVQGDASGGDLTSFAAIDPLTLPPGVILNMPPVMPYGLFSLTMNQVSTTAGLRVQLPSPAPQWAKWYKCSAQTNGCIDFSRDIISGGTGDGAVFSDNRSVVTLYLTDNGLYDDNLTEHVINDPSGLGGACFNSVDCDDGLFCNGPETCSLGACGFGAAPCAAGYNCDESQDSCVQVTTTTTVVSTTTTTLPATTTTTTSVVPTTTTTTTTPRKPCPAKNVLGANNPNLENLRDFRDSRLANSAVGRKVIQMYYKNADSINAALERNPALRAVARRVLEGIAPMVGKD